MNYSDFYGSIDYDGNLNLTSKANISSIILPLTINGTIQNPDPSFTLFIPKFIFWNILTILNPVNIFNFTIDIFIGIYRTVVGMSVYLWDLVSTPIASAAVSSWNFIISPFTSSEEPEPTSKDDKGANKKSSTKTQPVDKKTTYIAPLYSRYNLTTKLA